MIYKEKAVKDLLSLTLKEDIATGDITSRILINPKEKAKANIIAKENGVICGVGLIKEIISLVDKKARVKLFVKDGQLIKKNSPIAIINGNKRSILKSERIILNFLGHLCGVATKTKIFTDKVKGTKAKIIDTRKTTPGMRLLHKYAVRCAGGINHRSSLDKQILIKDNHIKGQDILQVLKLALKYKPKNIKVEIEVENLKDFKNVLSFKPDIIMLDNMKPAVMKQAVIHRNRFSKGVLLEASGNVTLNNVRSVALTGVDFISVGELTHSVKNLDVSMEFV